ncbi:hypothetical protein J2803_001038 [Paraburkholderia phenoliruptrix]|nr:hypothetical protein [Paraburkholderia phenoliruptrix]
MGFSFFALGVALAFLGLGVFAEHSRRQENERPHRR